MIALAAAVVALLWGMTIATGIRLFLPLRQADRRSSTSFFAALSASLALTLSFPPVYVFVDAFLGGRNFASLTQHTCLLLCSFFVARMMLQSINRLSRRTASVLTVGLAVALVVQTTAFLLITPIPTTVDLMLASHTQVAALVFSMAHFLPFGAACAIAMVVAVVLVRSVPDWSAKVSGGALFIGGAAGVVNVAVVAIRDTSRLLGNMAVEALDPTYRVLIFVIAIGFCVGLSLPSIAGSTRRKRIGRLIPVLKAADARGAEHGWKPARLDAIAADSTSEEYALQTLSALTVRLRDGQMFGNGPELTPQELIALSNAENLMRRWTPKNEIGSRHDEHRGNVEVGRRVGPDA